MRFYFRQSSFYTFVCLYSLGLCAVSMILEWVYRLEPCPLCISQRLAFFTIAFVAALAAILIRSQRLTLFFKACLFFLNFLGLYFAAKQLYLQHLPPEQVISCMPSLKILMAEMPRWQLLQLFMNGSADCAKVTFFIGGLSLAAWSFISFGLLLSMMLFFQWTQARTCNRRTFNETA